MLVDDFRHRFRCATLTRMEPQDFAEDGRAAARRRPSGLLIRVQEIAKIRDRQDLDRNNGKNHLPRERFPKFS